MYLHTAYLFYLTYLYLPMISSSLYTTLPHTFYLEHRAFSRRRSFS